MKKNFKTILAILLVICMLPVLPISVFAEGEKTIGDYFADATAFEVTGTDVKTYKLLKNIEVGATYTEEFVGILDGNGNTITTSAPIFQTIVGGTTVSNLTVNGAVSRDTSTDHTGVLACTFKEASGTVKVDNFTNNATIEVKAHDQDQKGVGSIVGWFKTTKAEFTNCTNNGDVTVYNNGVGTQRPYVGGFIGNQEGSATLVNCINNGDIIGNSMTGGLIGYCSVKQNGSITIEKCGNTGAITTKNNGGMTNSWHYCVAGGIIGGANCNRISITYSFNTGAVHAETTGTLSSSYRAAASGMFNSTDAGANYQPLVNNCYSGGEVTSAAAGEGATSFAALIMSEYHRSNSTTESFKWNEEKMNRLTQGNFVASDVACKEIANGNPLIHKDIAGAHPPIDIKVAGFERTFAKADIANGELTKKLNGGTAPANTIGISGAWAQSADTNGYPVYTGFVATKGDVTFNFDLATRGVAAVRMYSEKNTGLRFTAQIKGDDLLAIEAAFENETIEYGMLIAAKTDVDAATEFTHTGLAGKTVIDAASARQDLEIDGTYFVFTGANKFYSTELLATDYCARAYVKIGDTYFYSYNYTVSDAKDIATKALADVSDTNDGEEYVNEITVETATKYSPYTTADQALLAAYSK